MDFAGLSPIGSWICWLVEKKALVNTEVLIYRGSVPLHVNWTSWSKWNPCKFEGVEHSTLDLKFLLLCTVYDWMPALSGHSFSNLEEFLDICNVHWYFVATLIHLLCTWGALIVFISIKVYYLSKNMQSYDKPNSKNNIPM